MISTSGIEEIHFNPNTGVVVHAVGQVDMEAWVENQNGWYTIILMKYADRHL